MRLILMFIQCIQYFCLFVTRVTGSDILTSLPCILNYISCGAIDVENKVKKNLYQIELLPFVIKSPWTSSTVGSYKKNISLIVN